uniref:Uncharacterized protein n=1 Tax=Pyxicephalus adspersus TaxID=30357 RepID=A0AAV2ZSN3_PYXAD|nr:TPA: hypothetical protein GDO54_004809 [Pyxicephalus adspersus]
MSLSNSLICSPQQQLHGPRGQVRVGEIRLHDHTDSFMADVIIRNSFICLEIATCWLKLKYLTFLVVTHTYTHMLPK